LEPGIASPSCTEEAEMATVGPDEEKEEEIGEDEDAPSEYTQLGEPGVDDEKLQA